MFWAQNSRAKWLKEGDQNTKYFHALASIRKRKNSITSLTSNGAVIDDLTGIRDEAISFFSKIIKDDYSHRPIFNGLEFKKVAPEQSAFLIPRYSHSEIDDVVQSCNSQKAPGPDIYIFIFIKEAWEVIKYDIYQIVDEF